MKRRVKRKLFLMGMAVAAGACAPSFAKGSDKVGYERHDYSAGWQVAQMSILQIDRPSDGDAHGLMVRFRTMMSGLNANVNSAVDSAANRGWRLEMLQPVTIRDASGQTRWASKQFGLAFHLTF